MDYSKLLHSMFLTSIIFALANPALASRYKGRKYDRCITHANNGVPWCPTSTDPVTEDYIPGQKGNCQSNAKTNDCPLGFKWAYPEATCYRVRLKRFCECSPCVGSD